MEKLEPEEPDCIFINYINIRSVYRAVSFHYPNPEWWISNNIIVGLIKNFILNSFLFLLNK